MKIFLYLTAIFSIVPSLISTGSTDSVQGSYISLPENLKQLSLLDGALIRYTDFLRNIYYEDMPTEEINEKAIKLVQALFHVIPSTSALELSESNYPPNKIDFAKNLITNLAYLFVWNRLENEFTKLLAANQSNEKKTKTLLVAQKSCRNIVSRNLTNFGYAKKTIFLETPWETARLIILAALWEFKASTNFDYETLLKQSLVMATDTVSKAANLPQEIKDQLTQIKSQANQIGPKTTDETVSIQDLLKKESLHTLTENEFEQ